MRRSTYWVLILIFLLSCVLMANQRLVQSTATVVQVGPFVDKTDGITAVTLTPANVGILWRQPHQTTTIANQVTNGDFATSSGWTFNSGWSYGTLEATASTASTALTRTMDTAIVQYVAYNVCFDMTRSAGSVTVSLGGTSGTARSSTASNVCEVLVAGATQTLAFTGSGFTGAVDTVRVNQAALPITAAASGSSNDLVADANAMYNFELTAAQTAILGPHQLCFYQVAVFVGFCQDFDVVSSGWNDLINTGPADQGDVTAAIEALNTLIGTPDQASVSADIAAVQSSADTLTTRVSAGIMTIPKNTAYDNFTFTMKDASTGLNLVTGLSVSCQVSKDGGTLASCTNSVSEVGSGVYKTNIAAADLNADEAYFIFTAATARRLEFKIRTQR